MMMIMMMMDYVTARDGFENSIFEAKAKASSLRGQGQGQFS